MFQRERYVEHLDKACREYYVDTCAAREQGCGQHNAADEGTWERGGRGEGGVLSNWVKARNEAGRRSGWAESLSRRYERQAEMLSVVKGSSVYEVLLENRHSRPYFDVCGAQ